MFELEPERYELRAEPVYDFVPSRRDFLATLGGGLVVLLALPREVDAQRRGGDTPQNIGAWLHVAPDGRITVYSGKAEVGQNIRTSLAQVVAEELRVPVERITLVLGDTRLTPYDMGTFGSRTTPFMAPQLAKAAAAAREMLIDAAAQRWQADRATLTAGDGFVRHGENTLSYGDLAKSLDASRTIAAHVRPTPAREWRVAGHDQRKVNARSIVTGREKYVSDLKLPGLLHGRLIRPAAFKATLVSADLSAAQKLPGVVAVQDGDFLAVAHEDSALLEPAVKAVKAEWKAPAQTNSRAVFTWLKEHAAERAELTPAKGDVTLDATYEVAYIAHVPLEPRCAVAHWESADQLRVWTGTQVPFGVAQELARAFGIPVANVRVEVPATGSGYGGKHTGECAVEAARLAKAAGRPVKLQWTREEEFTWAYFRPAGVIDIRSGATRDGVITDWQFHNYNSGGAALASPYAIPGQQVRFHASDSPLRQGSYRGLAATANHFARESHMDELAAAVKMEPAAFRRKNASDERLRAVIDAATERFGWGKAPSRPGQGFGMMAGLDKGGYVSACVELTVTANRVRIDRIVQAFECGAIVNPDQLKNQVMGGLIMGLGGALFEQIEFADGRILNPRLSRYRVPRFSDIPAIDIVLLDRKDLPSAGAGETPIVAAAPAIANAIHQATGRRLRALPLKLA